VPRIIIIIITTRRRVAISITTEKKMTILMNQCLDQEAVSSQMPSKETSEIP